VGETVSSLEIIRVLVACCGLWVAYRGRREVQGYHDLLRVPPASGDARDRAEYENTLTRIKLFEGLQGMIALVHGLFLFNAFVQLFYPSAPSEQFNVLTSNAIQVLIPMLLIRGSVEMTHALRSIIITYRVAGSPGVANDPA